MANIRAIKNGVWSDATVWSPNAPTSTDDVFPVGFTIYVDQNITASSISTVGTTGIGGGGVFRPNNGVIMTTNVIAGSSTCVNFASASPNAFTLIGNVTGGNVTSGRGIDNTSTGTMNIIGNVNNGPGSGSTGVVNSSTGVVNITGVCSGLRSGTGASGNGVLNNSTGLINIYGIATGGIGGSSYGVYNAGAAPAIVTIYGTVSGYSGTNSFGAYNLSTGTIRLIGNVYGGQGTSTPGIVNNSTGAIEVTGSVYGLDFTKIDLTQPVGGSGSHGISNSNGPVTVVGNVYGSNMRSDAFGVNNSTSAGTVTVIGDVYGGTGPLIGTSSSSYGISNGSTGTVTISGSAIGGSAATAYGAFNGSSGILRVKRAVGNDWGLNSIGVNGSTPGVFSNAAASQTYVEELQCGARGQWPTGGVTFFTPNTKATSTFQTSTLQTTTLIESNSADSLLPPVSSVRQGTTYNLGLSTGNCFMPVASTVAFGVPVDNTIGTAVLTPASTWNYALTSITDIASIGGRLRNASTTSGTGSLLTSFNL